MNNMAQVTFVHGKMRGNLHTWQSAMRILTIATLPMLQKAVITVSMGVASLVEDQKPKQNRK